ncbi:hypothetical protein [Limosilactobacillus frumenti]|nr:hypothetical protein [Limosilactobacillus frumenti]MBA2914459.1 hypothetical protein [Limosilactobacillus frumenti]QFG72454.1 hypothetical protein LF145_03480 [Limosilactobacillus frumenti]
MKITIKTFAIIIIPLLVWMIATPADAANRQQTIANHELKQDLATHQAYANDDPGNYDYAKFIKKIKYTGHDHIVVEVKNSFSTMNKADKTRILDQVQGLAIQVLQNNHLITKRQAHHGLKATIRTGHAIIGKSKHSNYYQYSWK